MRAKTGHGAELEGWATSVMTNMPKFNRPLQRLAAKNSSAPEMDPAMELALALTVSAVGFHFAKKASIDPNLAMDFMGYVQNKMGNQEQQNDGGRNISTHDPMGVPVSNPMGMRPNVPVNTRRNVNNNRPLEVESDIDTSENTEEVRV